MAVDFIHVDEAISESDGRAIADVKAEAAGGLDTKFPGIVPATDMVASDRMDVDVIVGNAKAGTDVQIQIANEVQVVSDVGEDRDDRDVATDVKVLTKEGNSTQFGIVITNIQTKGETIVEGVAEFGIGCPAGVTVDSVTFDVDVVEPEGAAGEIVIPSGTVRGHRWGRLSGADSETERSEQGEKKRGLHS